VVASLVAAVGAAAAVSVKMRSGFDDTRLFRDNLLAVQVDRDTVTDTMSIDVISASTVQIHIHWVTASCAGA
jgi:tRNA-dihydrouridine synthase